MSPEIYAKYIEKCLEPETFKESGIAHLLRFRVLKMDGVKRYVDTLEAFGLKIVLGNFC